MSITEQFESSLSKLLMVKSFLRTLEILSALYIWESWMLIVGEK